MIGAALAFVLALWLVASIALGTFSIRPQAHPSAWATGTSDTVALGECPIRPGKYRLKGEGYDDQGMAREASFPLQLANKHRHDRPFGTGLPSNIDTVGLLFSANESSLQMQILDADGKCMAMAQLRQETDFTCNGDWLEKETPHMSAAPTVGPHGHSLQLRYRAGYLEVRKVNWMLAFLYIVPGTMYGTS